MRTSASRYIQTACIAAVLFLVAVSTASADVWPMPSTVTVARGEAASRSITYRFLDVPPGTYTSEGGEFLVGIELIGSNNDALTARAAGTTAVVTEGLSVPATVIDRALSRHSNMITYQRTFSNGIDSFGVEVQILITSEAGSDFEIKRLELYFANRRAETTVHRNDKNLKAYVEMRFAGSGIFQAFWEVDGRVLATINQHMVSAGSATLESPDIPALPTYEPGSHVVRFVITSPSPELTVPSIVYYVLPDETGGTGIELLSPGDGEEVEALPRTFRWTGSALASTYMIRYFDDPESDPVFSAYTGKTSYSLPSGLPGGAMAAGGKYYWSVVALDAEGNKVGQSETMSFVLK